MHKLPRNVHSLSAFSTRVKPFVFLIESSYIKIIALEKEIEI